MSAEKRNCHWQPQEKLPKECANSQAVRIFIGLIPCLLNCRTINQAYEWLMVRTVILKLGNIYTFQQYGCG